MKRKRNKNYLILLLILSLGLFLRIFLSSGMSGYDDFAYGQIAYNMIAGTYRFSDVEGLYGFRYLLLWPTVLAFFLFGVNEFSSGIFPLLCSSGSVLLAFFLGKLVFEEKVGLYAALLYSFFPLSVVYGTMLYPDEILAFFMSLSVFVFIWGERSEGGKSGRLFFLSGLFLGIGYFSRSAALLLLLFYGCYILGKGGRIRHLWCLIGLLSLLILEGSICHFLTGDFFFRWHSISDHFFPPHIGNFDRIHPNPSLTRFDIYPKAMFGFHLYGLALFGFFYPATVIAILYYLGRRNIGKIWLPLVWLITLFLYLEFGTLSLKSYKIVFKQLRFLSILAMPALLILASFLNSLDRKKFISRISLIMCAFLFLTSCIGAYRMSEYRKASVKRFKEAYDFLKTQETKRIFVVERGWELSLNFFAREPLKYSYYAPTEERRSHPIQDISEPESPPSLKDSYVIIDEKLLERIKNENLKKRTNERLNRVKRDGQLLWEKGRTKIYFVPRDPGEVKGS